MRTFIPLFVIALFFAVNTHAQESDVFDDKFAEPFEYDESLREKWKEQQVDIPEYPKSGDLLDADIGGGEDPYKYKIDIKTLKAGEDGVVRYIVVISSDSGASNVMYEGIYCSNLTYKTYAYGSQKKFIPARNPRWKPVRKSGRVIFRYHLASNYFCEQHGMFSLPTKEIIRKIKYQEDVPPMGRELGM